MLRILDEMEGYVLEATDGEIGRCKDFLFSDQTWVVRYMVANTGKWLPDRKVLISPIALGEADYASRRFDVMLTRDEIENAPDIFEDQPVSRQYEAALFEHLGHLPYWGGGSAWGKSTVPSRLRASDTDAQATMVAIEPEGDPHLRSLNEVTGYHIEATDGDIGHVETLIVDDEEWTIRYLVVDTRNWLPGRKVLVPPLWVDTFDWAGAKARVALTRDKIETSPPFEPGSPVNREYETRLYDYYGRPVYWR